MELEWAFPVDLRDIGRVAAEAEALGFAGLWTTETPHEPFLPTLAAGLATSRLRVGTGIATAFTRSPMVTALTAWDIQAATDGRFTLGLGSQVKAHNTRRFGTPADSPGPRMKELVECLRHIWVHFRACIRCDSRGASTTST